MSAQPLGAIEMSGARADFAAAFLTLFISRVREHLQSDGMGGESVHKTFARYPARLSELSLPREIRLAGGELALATQLLQVPFGADIRPEDEIQMPSGERYSVVALAEPRAMDLAQRLWCRPLPRSPGRMEGP